jgi:hypothetical protein
VATVLFCSDPLAPTRVDPQFAAQAACVRALGATVALIDHDALLAGRVGEAVRQIPRDLGMAWYRGWMIPTDFYRELDDALIGRNSRLIVDPDAYRSAHEFPGWYDTVRDVSPAGEWTFHANLADVPLVVRNLSLGPGPAIVKDFVKSRKHEWDEACYIPSLADRATTARVVSRFIELQGDDLQGGLVFRAYEDFGDSPEARVWWVDGAPVLVTAHPDTPAQTPAPDLAHISAAVHNLGCRFVTTDVAQRRDGVWRVIEVGDGQVSDFPAGVDPVLLFEPLLASVPR